VEGQPVSQAVKECQTGTLRAKTDQPNNQPAPIMYYVGFRQLP